MNLELWEKVRSVPEDAKKEIKGGRLNGMTDINPVWRIKTLTEQFGICGIGWKYEIVSKDIIDGANGEKAAFVQINLYINTPDRGWSEAIPGMGGSMFVTQESKGMHTSDECYKMALTDAISVACKALGIGADVYWSADEGKYNTKPADSDSSITERQYGELIELLKMPGADKLDPKLTEAFQKIYKAKGYGRGRDIKQRDFPSVYDALSAVCILGGM